jgi:hypothetical protein
VREGVSESEIAACEFAERRLFDDLGADAEPVRDRAINREPSSATLGIVERDGYCASCVVRYYGAFAEACRVALSDWRKRWTH